MRRILIGPLISFVAIAAIAVIGGQLNTVDANGRVVDDWKGYPVAGAEVTFGKRTTVGTDEQGKFEVGLVPRDAKLSAVKRGGYGTTNFTADQHEVRLQPATLTLQVNDSATGKGVPLPKAMQGDNVLQTGSDTGSMAIAPHPGKDVNFTICAKDYQKVELSTEDVEMVIRMDPKQGEDCPVPPSPSPSPSESPLPSPGASPASPSASTTPAPSASPSPTTSP